MSFLEELWESIFTPGPTPSILRATNITFAALQILLATLLLATSSVHFVVLSILCAGLWRSINWFAAELAVSQERDKSNPTLATSHTASTPATTSATTAKEKNKDQGRNGSDDSDTEVEGETRVGRAAGVEAVETRGEMRRREVRPEDLDAEVHTQSSASTEDEWERVSESEDKQ